MAASRTGSEMSGSVSGRSFSEVSELDTMRLGVDIVQAARRNLLFCRTVSELEWLHEKKTVVEAIRRYDELWMPLISDLTEVGLKPPLVLPPIDVEWVWFCHTLNPVIYRQYCETKFSKLISKPAIFDEENEEYALMRCQEKWAKRYPSEPFENEANSDMTNRVSVENEELFMEVTNHRNLYSKFSEPYRFETVYLIAARQRYKRFLHMLLRFSDECSCLVPASDILLMWLNHQSYPTVYAEDLKEVEDGLGKVVNVWQTVTEREVEETKMLWERTFDQPYEKAGGGFVWQLNGVSPAKPPVYWDVSNTDVNTKYKLLMPRFLLEVCVFVRLGSKMKEVPYEFSLLRTIRCHGELKLDKPISEIHDSWQKAWHLYCEFGTKGVVVEFHWRGNNCFKGSSVQERVTFYWNELLRDSSLTLERKIDPQARIVASVTPPVQAPYLLKCVADKVTDDSGAMISDVILRLNHYRPQEGRWLSRTVLDHTGRECFIIRIRVGGGFWRRGGETPSGVKWEDRIVEIREGSWSYVAGSIGRAPEKVVGTATPKQPSEHWKAAWDLSNGAVLMIDWDSTTSISGLSFSLKNQDPELSVKLLKGRKMQYQVSNDNSENERRDEDWFVTLVRCTEDDPTGRATALLNWKLLVVELMPEEDAVFILTLCICILRSVSEMRKEDVGNLLVRRRLKEARLGIRDWGSVIVDPHSSSSSVPPSPHLQPWYWNAEAVMAVNQRADYVIRQPAFTYSQAEGGDRLYRKGIIP